MNLDRWQKFASFHLRKYKYNDLSQKIKVDYVNKYVGIQSYYHMPIFGFVPHRFGINPLNIVVLPKGFNHCPFNIQKQIVIHELAHIIDLHKREIRNYDQVHDDSFVKTLYSINGHLLSVNLSTLKQPIIAKYTVPYRYCEYDDGKLYAAEDV